MDSSWVAPTALLFVLAFVTVIGGIYYYAEKWMLELDKEDKE